jgi:outer membrane protein OmpA-like peptidoglycan-associated protein
MRRGWAAAVVMTLGLGSPAVAQAPPRPVPLEAAVTQAAAAVFGRLELPAEGRVSIVIDPLVDGATGAESAATRVIERQLLDYLRREQPKVEVLPFTRDNVERADYVFIGTLTLINNAGAPQGPRDAYRVWFSLLDPKRRVKVAAGQARAAPSGVDHRPTPVFSDAPVYTDDPAVSGYIQSCQGRKVGEAVDEAYIAQLAAGAAIAEANRAYDAGQYEQARALFERASTLPGGDQLRAMNGLYLTLARLGRLEEAAVVFGRLVDYSLAQNRLAVKFLFRPGTTAFFGGTPATNYELWIEGIAERVAARQACLDVVGHTSPTGPLALNDRLSMQRAQAVLDRIAEAAPDLRVKLAPRGVGPRENLVGSGRDDASDALDRRVEFKVRAGC